MTLNINEPTDQRLVSELPSYIRQGRVAINAYEDTSGGEIDTTDLIISTGTTALVVGIDLSLSKLELIKIISPGVSNLDQIRGGTDGQIKIFVFGCNTISIVDGLKTAAGAFYLNQLPVLSTLAAQVDDVLAVVNIGGNGAGTYGYWKELWRQLSVK